MKNIRLLHVLLAIGIFMVNGQVFAQNPKQSQKHKKAAKKKTKAYKKPLKYVPNRGDEDGDGVEDYADHCAKTPKGMAVTPFGCPIDRDFDGTVDTLDACVEVPGPKENKGCPWPDTDKDGIVDKDDACPKIPGIQEFNGCPDSDGDKIPDNKDKCPQEFGIARFDGCPDRDNDGISDAEDECPDMWGIKENKGCPPINEEEKEALQEAFANLLFETGRAVIKISSFSSLNKLAKVMNNNTNTHLAIEGHTDSVGDNEANQRLSEARANAVKTYLQNKGVAEDRIVAEGFGETRPVASNDTREGKAKNRRVEFILNY